MKKLLIIPMLLLTACATTDDGVTPNLVTTKLQVVLPDPIMYNCPFNKELPKAETLTDIEVAKTVLELYKNNKTCKNSMDSLKKYLEHAKKTIENS
jgi:hypothetical protein